jgi:hypothetical protein
MLFEGTWPDETADRCCWSLDDVIDARFEWIDEQAQRIASSFENSEDICPAWLNALALRYYLVKLIRVIAYFTDVRSLGCNDRLELSVEKDRDEDYAQVVTQLCRQANADCRIIWMDSSRDNPSGGPFKAPLRQRVRTWRKTIVETLSPFSGKGQGERAERARQILTRVSRLAGPRDRQESPRVLLCGNPQLLGPVCRELLKRGARPWWLFERLAIRTWLKWRMRGVGQLVCDPPPYPIEPPVQTRVDRLVFRGVDLADAVNRWLAQRLDLHGLRQARLVRRVDEHFGRLRPSAVIVDEDATPMTRTVIAAAKRHGARSYVLQHGAPCCQFGFAPLEADRVLVWGRPSKEQLADWTVSPQRIIQTGSPRHERLAQVLAKRKPRRSRNCRILLLSTVPPRDSRPDAAGLNLTRRTYAEMLHWACSAVSNIPQATLIVKLHPRSPTDPIARDVLSRYPNLKRVFLRKASLERWLLRSDCVLSCISSAGIDATLARRPVIQLLPRGCGNVLPSEKWGTYGTARSAGELRELLAGALSEDKRTMTGPHSDVFGPLDGLAATRIVDAVLPSNETGDGPEIISARAAINNVTRTGAIEVRPLKREPATARTPSQLAAKHTFF